MHLQNPSVSLGNWNRNSGWADGSTSPLVQSDVGDAAPTPAPRTASAVSVDDYFDVGPEKEALLSLMRESTRSAQESRVNVAPSGEVQRGEKALPYPPSTSSLSGHDDTQSFVAPLTTTSMLPPHYSAPKKHHSYTKPSADTELQQKCEAAQAKTETLARHLVKAISDRKILKDNVEQLELLVEECNAEVGRLQRVVEEQHQDSATSLGVQAALRAKEREVAVYEDEIRRLNGVLDGYLTRTAASKRAVEDSVHNGLVAKEAEVEAAMEEVGLAHLAQREAEERANQLANELDTAVEQIQFLDERLAEMERAVAAARFHAIPPGIVREQVMNGDNDDDNGANTALSHASAAARLAVPPTNEMRHWPPEARQAVLQLAAQAEELLLQNAEGERHASMRLQYVEKTCSELQQHLVQRSEEVERARETCQQLRQEKSALQTVGDQWFQQLRQVKEDAQLVSEMVCTAREDAEDVYLSSRVAAERAMEHQAARAAASPLRPLPSPSPMDPATLEKTARFAQQVMHDFQAMARFLASLRTMNIGDRNGYQILQIIASGHSPAEGLYVTADDDATPMRLRERLSSNAASETRRRVQDRKARVLRAVEQALTIEPDSAPGFLSLAAPANRPSNDATIMMGLPPRSGKKPSTMETEACEVPDALEDAVGNEDEVEVEVALASLHPSQTGSKSIRDGSSGIVHSDVRRRPAHDLALFLPHHQASRTSESSSATPTFAASMPSIPLTPTGNVTFSTVSTSQPRTAKPTEALTTPPPSVSRPLRLSTTPSQPQSDGKQDNPEGEAPPSDRHSSPTRTSSHIALATDSTLIRRSGAGVDPDMSSIKIVPSPSMSPQMFQQQTETQKQAPRPHESMRETQASIPLLHSRLRSPTPDQLPAMSLEIDTNVALITNPIEQLRTPELFVDEPLPRLGSEEYRQPVHLGSQPKDRSTTARPSSTPHPGPHSVTRRSHKAGDGEESAAPLRQGDRRRRDASNDSNEDEATLFFRDPPRGEVQEVTSKPTPASPKGQHSQVKVDLLRDDLLMSSRKTLAEATTSAPASSLSSQRSSVVEEEADVEERDPCAGAPAAPLSLSHQSSLKQSHTAASPRSRSVDDNEPSLSFSAPPPPMRLSYSQGHPEKAAEDETLPRKSLSDEALSGIDHLRAIPGTGDTAVVSHSALPSPSAKSSSFVDSLEWGSHQPRRIPALDSGPCLTGLAGAVAAPPRLQRSAGSSSSPAAQPPLCTTIPEPTAAIGAAVGLRRHSCGGSEPAMASVSLDRPLLDVTPALVEPRRPSLSARSEPAATLKNAVTARGPVDSAVAVSARPSTPVEQTLPLSKGGKASRSTSEVVIHVDDVDLLRSDSKITANTSSSTPAHRLPSITSTATPGSPLRAMERSHEAFGLPGVICDDKPENLGSSHSFPAELPQAVLEHPRELPSRAGRKTAPHSGPREGAAPAPLPAVNVDTPESNTLNLRHDSPPPASLMGETATTDRGRSPSSPAVAVEPSPMTSTPRSAVTSQDGQPGMPNSTLTERGVPDDAAARRREDVANILKRIRAKKEQEKKQCFEMDAPATPTASEGSVAIPKEVNSPT
ncbi:hypothetical protein JKF63_01658 [Porcisia hertigi]|uniref:Uncharacterized protein n=1 Tax=Porcisia hertigi TaxID=2761500 RepID=A0A836IB14_9TRYP|nr:hypothetical protein JKF63_01658 [Porcisia hertigi]